MGSRGDQRPRIQNMSLRALQARSRREVRVYISVLYEQLAFREQERRLRLDKFRAEAAKFRRSRVIQDRERCITLRMFSGRELAVWSLGSKNNTYLNLYSTAERVCRLDQQPPGTALSLVVAEPGPQCHLPADAEVPHDDLPMRNKLCGSVLQVVFYPILTIVGVFYPFPIFDAID